MFGLAFASLAIATVFYLAGCPVPTLLFAVAALVVIIRGQR